MLFFFCTAFVYTNPCCNNKKKVNSIFGISRWNECPIIIFIRFISNQHAYLIRWKHSQFCVCVLVVLSWWDIWIDCRMYDWFEIYTKNERHASNIRIFNSQSRGDAILYIDFIEDEHRKCAQDLLCLVKYARTHIWYLRSVTPFDLHVSFSFFLVKQNFTFFQTNSHTYERMEEKSRQRNTHRDCCDGLFAFPQQ